MFGNLITSQEFGLRLNKLRLKAGYRTTRELALVMCGYPKDAKGFIDQESQVIDRKRRNINNWENGKCKPSVDEIALLCQLLNCDPEYLLYGDYQTPRLEVQNAMIITGLSEEAIENLIGAKEYGPTSSIQAIDFLLRKSTLWKFFARLQDTADDDALFSLASYLAPDSDLFYIRSSSDGSFTEFYENDFIQTAPENTFINAKFLFDRARLDALEISLRKLKDEYTKEQKNNAENGE